MVEFDRKQELTWLRKKAEDFKRMRRLTITCSSMFVCVSYVLETVEFDRKQELTRLRKKMQDSKRMRGLTITCSSMFVLSGTGDG
jgi:hypothetical protein